jgi:ABC-type multidrug transport system fused ATPase/permease subunit
VSPLRQVWSILQQHERRRAGVMLVLMLVGMSLEMCSIALVVPTLAIMTREASAMPDIVRPWVEHFGGLSSPRLILATLGVLLSVYAFKSVFLLLLAWWQSRFVSAVQASISRRLFSSFMSQPWPFHLERNSSSLIQTVAEAQGFSQVCMQLLQVMSESLVAIGLLSILFWYEPVGAVMVAAVLGTAALLFSRVARSRSRSWAQRRHQHGRALLKHLQQGLGGAKEVKVRGCEIEFVNQFRAETEGVARMSARQSFVDHVPRTGFEFAAVAALFFLASAMVWQDHAVQSIVPMLGLFVTVAFRLLPSVNFATLAVQRVRYARPMIESLHEHLSMPQPADSPALPEPVSFQEVIRITGLAYRYPSGQEPVLKGIDLAIRKGTSTGLVGGSGQGKSTLVDSILGLLPPTSGRITVDGVDIQRNPRGWRQIVGYVPQSIYLCDDTIRRNIAFGVPEASIDEDAVRRAITAARLDGLVRSLPDGVNTNVGERGVRLSGGERQRIGIARALYHNPEVLVLDEATSALDNETEREVMEAVESLHGTHTIIIVAHRLSTMARCDVLHRIEGGRVVQSGTFAEVATH